MSDERLTRLESIVMEQERTIEQLSGQIAEQWTVLETLQRRYAALVQRFLALEEAQAPDIPVTKPPHW